MNKLIVLLGPTGVGKTDLSLRLAQQIQSPIISSDSRQIYQGLTIGTAAPNAEQLNQVRHYFVGCLDISEYYSASKYEEEVIDLLTRLYQKHENIVMSGGSMMYIDAVCKGIDDLPTIDEKLRKDLLLQYENEGLEPFRRQLKLRDPVFYNQVDLKNHKRVIHAVEVCLMTGKPYSSLRTNSHKERSFQLIKIGLNRERKELYDRINCRVDGMIASGLVEEARKFYPYRHYNSLNTVGYKEIFNYLDGSWDLDVAIEKIKQHTRIYARKQLTWFKRDPEIHWFHPAEEEKIIQFIVAKTNFSIR